MKLAKYFLLFGMILMIASCTKSNGNLLETIIEYQEKLDSIIVDDESDSTALEQAWHIPADDLAIGEEFDPDKLIPREEFQVIYDQQIHNTFDVQLDDILMPYKELLDETVAKLEELEVIEAIVYLTIDFGNNQSLDAAITMSPDQGIVLKMTLDFEDMNLYYGIKLGYEGTDFYIRELSKNDDTEYYDYFEFMENHYVVNAMYAGEDYWYQYRNQVDSTYYSISEQSGSFTLAWYNPETMVRTILSDEGQLRNFELFNEKGVLFTYSEYVESDTIEVAWQLLEATGWDAAYMTIGNSSIYTGIYQEGVLNPIEARQYNIDHSDIFANVRLEIQIQKENFTEDVLNLSVYGLDFQHPELTVSLIQSKIASAKEESAYLSIYRGVDFLNDDLSVALYTVVDSDVKPN